MNVSIVILNYNYGRFLAQAVDSALAQTHPGVEVVVVDNGSTDDSPEVLRQYEGRVRVVRQAINIGQGRGYNLGFEAARGDWLIWLDADDLLDRDAIDTCLRLAGPATSKVQFPLRLIDAEGQRLPGHVPHVRHHGNVVPIIQRFGHYAGPPGSGNLYRRAAIARYFPVEPTEWPICTDTVPFITAAFHGDVVDTRTPLGAYRLHRRATGATPGYHGNYSTDMAAEVRLNTLARDRTLALLRDRSGIDVSGPFLVLPTHVRHRIISWCFSPAAHPFPDDDAASLWRLLCQSLDHCPGYSRSARLTMKAWAFSALHLPGPIARRALSANRHNPLLASLIRWSRGPGA